MSDRLEDFVKQHRAQFDLHEPDPSIWLKINPASQEMKQAHRPESRSMSRSTSRPMSRPMRWLRIAAAVAMIFAGSTAGIYFLTGEKADSQAYSDLYTEIRETEHYYSQMVADRFEELQPYLAGNPAASEMLSDDMNELDEVYAELKNDLKDNASNPEVIEAMILNYRVKLEILEDLLNQLKEKENQDEKDESYSL
jgi:predicted CopG family antitoxin